jgi:hypothetical protein
MPAALPLLHHGYASKAALFDEIVQQAIELHRLPGRTVDEWLRVNEHYTTRHDQS